jgi:hypothetical protein
MPEIITIKCPFCKEGDIKISHRERQIITKKSTCRAGGKNMSIQHAKDEVLSDCQKCSKTIKEISKRLKEGKQVSCKDAAKRMEEAGLPTRF